MDDNDLARRIRDGDAAAFEQLFRSYHARLCSFAYRYLEDRAAAEETVQDLFLSLWQKRAQLHITGPVRAYLFGALRNRVLNRSARARLEQRWLDHNPEAEFDVADPAPAADLRLQESETAERVRAAVAELPPACQTVLLLRWQQDMSYAEIAQVLGVAPKTVENNLNRARHLLRGKLLGD